jgi:5-formyltetrahydrofolate cyclo-ligase
MTHTTKSEWRRALLAARTAIPEATRRAASAAIAERVRALPYFSKARTILGYAAIGAEVDPASLFVGGGTPRLQMLLPVPGSSRGAPRWRLFGELLAETDSGLSANDLRYPVLALVPGVGFDRSGVRLGRGSGFYDRALADLRQVGMVWAVGLAFERQIVPVLPTEPWDERVDCLVSELRLLMIPPRARHRDSAAS